MYCIFLPNFTRFSSHRGLPSSLRSTSLSRSSVERKMRFRLLRVVKSRASDESAELGIRNLMATGG